jgi:hypothetical protein
MPLLHLKDPNPDEQPPSSIIKKTAITISTPLQHERRRQIRGLMLLAFAVIAFSVLHAGIHNVSHPGWWHPW